MQNSTHSRKTTKKFSLPVAKVQTQNIKRTLPYNGKAVSEKSFSFSFACFDRSHKLFNLGDNSESGTMSANWFIDLLDCFKSVNNMNVTEARLSLHDLHPVDWGNANTSAPSGADQLDYWQFRINKSKGRIIGFLIEDVFYIVWLDPHHNLTNSDGYGNEKYYRPAMSIYEIMESEIEQRDRQIVKLQKDLQTAEEIIFGYLK